MKLPFGQFYLPWKVEGLILTRKMNHYHGNGIFEKVIILLNQTETISNLPLASRLYKVIWGYVTPPAVHNLL